MVRPAEYCARNQLQDARNYLLLSIHAVDSYLAAAVFSKDSVQTVRIGWFTSAPAVC